MDVGEFCGNIFLAQVVLVAMRFLAPVSGLFYFAIELYRFCRIVSDVEKHVL